MTEFLVGTLVFAVVMIPISIPFACMMNERPGEMPEDKRFESEPIDFGMIRTARLVYMQVWTWISFARQRLQRT